MRPASPCVSLTMSRRATTFTFVVNRAANVFLEWIRKAEGDSYYGSPKLLSVSDWHPDSGTQVCFSAASDHARGVAMGCDRLSLYPMFVKGDADAKPQPFLADDPTP